jgi:hypothetical protein
MTTTRAAGPHATHAKAARAAGGASAGPEGVGSGGTGACDVPALLLTVGGGDD